MIKHSSRWFRLLLTLGLLSLLAAAAACGGGGDDDGDAPDDTDAGEVSLDVAMTDNKFGPGEFTVAPGASVTLNLINDGAAIHNLRIAGEDGEYNTGDDTVSDPEMINGGEPGAVEWTAPESSGEIKFQCDFHPTDMVGTISVG